jgi:hypothetical protein
MHRQHGPRWYYLLCARAQRRLRTCPGRKVSVAGASCSAYTHHRKDGFRSYPSPDPELAWIGSTLMLRCLYTYMYVRSIYPTICIIYVVVFVHNMSKLSDHVSMRIRTFLVTRHVQVITTHGLPSTGRRSYAFNKLQFAGGLVLPGPGPSAGITTGAVSRTSSTCT